MHHPSMRKRLMEEFYSAPFCVELILRHTLSHLFCEICQHKELLRGSRSCAHPWAGATGRSQTVCGLVRTHFLRCEGGGVGVVSSSPYFTPVTLTECAGKHRSRSLRVCGWKCTRDYSGIPAVFVNHIRSCRRKVTDPSGASQPLARWGEVRLQ